MQTTWRWLSLECRCALGFGDRHVEHLVHQQEAHVISGLADIRLDGGPSAMLVQNLRTNMPPLFLVRAEGPHLQ